MNTLFFRSVALLRFSRPFAGFNSSVGISLTKTTVAFAGRRTVTTMVQEAVNVTDAGCHGSLTKHVFDSIIKGQEDKRSYRGLELHNGMKVLLISDPETDKSAASMDVNVGHLLDPWELPGLAHFCEHMLFLGTEKYPVENDYQKFLSTHGGTSNAFTSTDHTNYFFDVAPDHLESALDRFAQFFLSPLFNDSATEREVNAVDSENANNLQNDMWRLAQLERSLSQSDHVYSKFGTGSKVTLLEDAKTKGLDPREELLKFHKANYSSNLMGFAILGKESLDELEKMVVPRLAHAQNKSLTSPEWLDHPYGEEQVGKLVKVAPVKDLRALHVTFPIPDLHPHYQCQPGHYLGHLLGHEGPGSLLSELKRRGWVNSLVGGPGMSAKGFGFFSVDVDLSPEGEEHVEDIVLLIFQYLAMLRESGPLEWVHRECEELNKIKFRFKDKQNPSSYVSALSTALRFYPTEEVLFAPYMMPNYDPAVINMVMEKLVPENMTVVVVSKKFEGKLDQKERWYQTEYSRESLSGDLLSRLGHPGTHESISIPDPNEFIPKDFDLKPRDDGNGPLPELIKNDSLTRIWYLQDKEYLLPKCCIFFQLTSPYVYVDPLHANLAAMFATCLRDAMNEYAYAAELAGLRYSFDNTKYSLMLTVRGYSEKQSVLLEKLVAKITAFKPDPKRFETLKETYVRGLKNFKMEQPYQHAVYYSSLLLNEKIWSKDEMLKETEALTVERLESFIPEFLSGLHIEALVHGNTTKQNALELVEDVRKMFANAGTRSLFESQLRTDREVKLPEGKHYVYQTENEIHPNSAVEVFLQTGEEDTRSNMLLELLCQIINEPAFDQLRTKEQLGYIVWSGTRRSNGTQGMRFIVQSERGPKFVESRIEAFLHSMLDEIEKMSAEELERHRTALETRRLEKPKTLVGRASKFWTEITLGTFNFDRDNIEVESLKGITKEELLDYFKGVISADAQERKKLSIWVVGTKAKESAAESQDQEIGERGDADAKAEIVDDIVAFKTKLPLYPTPQPFIPISDFAARSRL